MITATVAIKEEREPNKVYVKQVEFDTVGEIENYLAYNRAYIKGITFNGAIEYKEDE